MKIQGCCIYSLNTYLTFIFSYQHSIQYAQCCMSTESQFLLLILQLNMHIFLFKLWNINKIQHIFLKLEPGFKFQICVRHNYLYVSFSVDLHWCLINIFHTTTLIFVMFLSKLRDFYFQNMFFHITCLVLNITEVLYAYSVTVLFTCNDHYNDYQTDEYPSVYQSIVELYRWDTGQHWGINTLCYIITYY